MLSPTRGHCMSPAVIRSVSIMSTKPEIGNNKVNTALDVSYCGRFETGRITIYCVDNGSSDKHPSI